MLVAALDATFERKPFSNIAELIPMSENIVKLSAVCQQCGQDAAFSKRTSDEKGLEVIGGADKYIAACRRCFFKPHNNYSNNTTPLLPVLKRKFLRNPNELKELAASWTAKEKKFRSQEHGNTNHSVEDDDKENMMPVA
jgi:hypothetical protein